MRHLSGTCWAAYGGEHDRSCRGAESRQPQQRCVSNSNMHILTSTRDYAKFITAQKVIELNQNNDSPRIQQAGEHLFINNFYFQPWQFEFCVFLNLTFLIHNQKILLLFFGSLLWRPRQIHHRYFTDQDPVTKLFYSFWLKTLWPKDLFLIAL